MNAKINKAKVSYKQIYSFIKAANEYLKLFPEETKLKYAITKVANQVNEFHKQWMEKLSDIELDHALTDADTGRVFFTIDDKTGKRNYQFDKEGIKASDAAKDLAFEDKSIEFEPYLALELPKGLHESWIEVFKPFVIDPDLKVELKTPEIVN
ncbi:hypothetical protein [Solitalea canadensis]|uniref:Uncharacterized protein n=1 Tax=Solitalea canadensis (strain ATCC 29591 / DSM 3403 / JCM 21819 / LMG 8368 / NBRC 15130 / NCIMB 12057 / USAM 9D) TaxID=929556 RepID=H8KPQ4_SOLCM|nr:hypothetical protein [Solitalea canadensis]AFD05952.1 hypothetical protein Solca_0837 [Solitalea canadensis DSM 3403]